MTDHDDHDTEAAPTEQASPPTTELPPANHAAPELAWSSDDDTAEVEAPYRGSPLVWSALVALVVAIVGALIFLGTTLFGSGSPKPVEPSAKPAPSTSMPVAGPPPAPSTVTVTAEAPPAPSAVTPTTVAELTDADYKFISDLERDGMRPGTKDAAEFSVSNAHQVCTYRASHDEATTQSYAASVTSWMLRPNPAAFTSLAEVHYCSQYLPAGY